MRAKSRCEFTVAVLHLMSLTRFINTRKESHLHVIMTVQDLLLLAIHGSSSNCSSSSSSNGFHLPCKLEYRAGKDVFFSNLIMFLLRVREARCKLVLLLHHSDMSGGRTCTIMAV